MSGVGQCPMSLSDRYGSMLLDVGKVVVTGE